jgi:hypothetical protein
MAGADPGGRTDEDLASSNPTDGTEQSAGGDATDPSPGEATETRGDANRAVRGRGAERPAVDGFKRVAPDDPGMEKTPSGTSVGVDDPYAHVDRCDHCTDEGRCRFAVEQGDRDPEFADARSRDGFQCPVVSEAPSASTERTGPEATREHGRLDEEGLTGPWDWADCPHFRCRNRDRECARCGLEEVRLAHDDERPLLEEHHLSYADAVASETGEGDDRAGDSSDTGDGPTHEITVYLCRWCHAKIHDSWARIDDDVNPDPEAIAEREGRRSREQEELGFQSAAERYERGDGTE